MVFLGIDAGTTRIKVGLVDIEGRLIDVAGLDMELTYPFEGACEMDMAVVWETVCKITRTLASRQPRAWALIRGVGVCGQGDGFWPIDQALRPVRNAILWNDSRTRRVEMSALEAFAPLMEASHSTPLFPGSNSLILNWLRANEPESYNKVAAVLHCKDFINLMLSGELCSDYSDASTGMIDIFNKRYVPELFEALGLGDKLDLFPPLVPSTKVIGEVSASGSEATGIRAGTPIVGGAIDVSAVASGAGAVGTGDACSIVGTTLCNEIVLEASSIDLGNHLGSNLCHIVPDRYLRLMAALSGTIALNWVRKEFFLSEPWDIFESEASSVEVGSGGLVFQPYLFGERAPFRNPFARGGFFGLTGRHSRAHIAHAAYEGIALSLVDCYKHLPPIGSRIFLTGGGSKSPLLCQMVADALGRTVVHPSTDEPGIIGIVNATRIGIGAARDFESIVSTEGSSYTPDASLRERYDELYSSFKALREAMNPLWSG